MRINGHEADLNSVTEPQRIKDSDENKKSISYAVKNELFLIKKNGMAKVWKKVYRL